MRACQPARPLPPVSTACSAGSRYASVLPLPVRARARMSLPSRACAKWHWQDSALGADELAHRRRPL